MPIGRTTLALIAVIITLSTAGGQVLLPTTTEVFELNVAAARVVVRATVERAEPVKDNRLIVLATISVDRRLKGTCPDRFEIEVAGDHLLPGHPYLFLLGAIDAQGSLLGSAGDYGVVPLFQPSEDPQNVPTDGEILTIDGSRPWSEAEGIASEVCADPQVRAGRVGSVSDGQFDYPIIRKTEQHFIRVAASENPRERMAASAVLREFNTPQSIGVLQGLMKDPFFVDCGLGASHTHYYPVRAAAREALDHLRAGIPTERVEDALIEYVPLSTYRWETASVFLVFTSLLWIVWRTSHASTASPSHSLLHGSWQCSHWHCFGRAASRLAMNWSSVAALAFAWRHIVPCYSSP